MVLRALLFLAAIIVGLGPAQAEQIYQANGFDIRWDNIFRYSIGARLQSPNHDVLNFPNADDGDRSFAPGLMTDRIDLLSVLDLSGDDFGAQISLAAWYDSVYHARNDDNAATVNATSVPPGHFVRATRNIDGQYAELGDTFAYANLAFWDTPVSLRVGRQTLLWGESLFYGANSIAAAQAPIDYVKRIITPDSYSTSAYLPVNQVLATVQPAANISFAAYYQLEGRPDRLAGVGSYFSTTDIQGAGAQRAYLQPGTQLLHIANQPPSADGQYGASMRVTLGEINWGFYMLRFDSKYPVVSIINDQNGIPAYFHSIYPSGVDLYGLSFSAYFEGSNIAGEISTRRDIPLVSRLPISLYSSTPLQLPSAPGYAEGDTLQGQISSVTTLPPSALWQSADLSLELAASDLLTVTRGRANLAPGRKGAAGSIRGLIQPHYFEVLPNLDVSLLAGIGLNFGGSSMDYTVNSGTGDFELGVSATYHSVWKVDLTFHSFVGSSQYQPLVDRGFLLLGLERAI